MSEDAHCLSCGEASPRNECPKSKRDCGHHCNHSWTHDACDWCGVMFGEEGEVHGRSLAEAVTMIGDDRD